MILISEMQLNIEKKNVFGFVDNIISIGFRNFCLLWPKNFASAVNALTSSVKISDLNKRDIFNLDVSQDDLRTR